MVKEILLTFAYVDGLNDHKVIPVSLHTVHTRKNVLMSYTSESMLLLSICKIQFIYKVAHLLGNLGWVDFDLCGSTVPLSA